MRGAAFGLAVLVLAAPVLAGCLGAQDRSVQPDTAETGPRTPLAEPPTWEVGDWWTLRLDRPLWDEPLTVTRVVAAVEGDTYVMGVPADEWDARLAFVHVPGLGEVNQGNLSYDMHDRDFRPVDFPLTDGKTWQTTHDGVEVDATVTGLEDGKAQIHFCCNMSVTATYDPSIGALERLEAELYGYEVLDHGSGYEGEIGIPRGQDLVLLTGAFYGVVGFGLEPGLPVSTVEVSDGYDRMMLAQLAGPLDTVDKPASGVYVERAEAPDGTTYETTNGPTDTRWSENVWEVQAPGGTWTFEHVAAGLGLAVSEGIAYDWVEVELGTGGQLVQEGAQ